MCSEEPWQPGAAGILNCDVIETVGVTKGQQGTQVKFPGFHFYFLRVCVWYKHLLVMYLHQNWQHQTWYCMLKLWGLTVHKCQNPEDRATKVAVSHPDPDSRPEILGHIRNTDFNSGTPFQRILILILPISAGLTHQPLDLRASIPIQPLTASQRLEPECPIRPYFSELLCMPYLD